MSSDEEEFHFDDDPVFEAAAVDPSELNSTGPEPMSPEQDGNEEARDTVPQMHPGPVKRKMSRQGSISGLRLRRGSVSGGSKRDLALEMFEKSIMDVASYSEDDFTQQRLKALMDRPLSAKSGDTSGSNNDLIDLMGVLNEARTRKEVPDLRVKGHKIILREPEDEQNWNELEALQLSFSPIKREKAERKKRLKRLVNNTAKVSDDSDKIALQKAFKCIDKDKDGKLSASDIAKTFKWLKHRVSPDEIENIVWENDRDGDGFIVKSDIRSLHQDAIEGVKKGNFHFGLLYDLVEFCMQELLPNKKIEALCCRKILFKRFALDKELEPWQVKKFFLEADAGKNEPLSFHEYLREIEEFRIRYRLDIRGF